ncbi:MAG: SGNH/GDSL hydrolase family protein [Planctomycetota bacterium]
MRKLIGLSVLLLGLAVGLAVPMDPSIFMDKETTAMHAVQVETLDLSAYPDAPPSISLRLLFIHHSCGGQLLASPGPEKGADCIYESHPNGGGLRGLLEENGYEVNEASYGSRLGQETDLFDWLPKFRDRMDEVLRCTLQDETYSDDRRNDIVMFKSCYPNNAFSEEGTAPGRSGGLELTVWNAKATYSAMLDQFASHPKVLFVCVTPPPLAPKQKPIPLWKVLARKLLGREKNKEHQAALARKFNNWLKAKDGWLKDYEGNNVYVLDYYDLLTGEGKSNLSRYPTGGGWDSHPSREGNEKAAGEFVPQLNRAVRRAGLSR